MDKIKVKAYGKVNLGLDVIRKREDGYHDLEMVMQQVKLHDDVVVSKRNDDKIIVTSSAMQLENGPGNLAYQATKVILDKFGIKTGVDIDIVKRIPIAGGMAGGSADCAATLKAVNELFECGLTEMELREIGVKLGADVPYCIIGKTAIARGIGEILEPVDEPPFCYVVIAKPPISVSTAYIYGNIKPDEIQMRPNTEGIVEGLKKKDLSLICNNMYNVMEEVTAKKWPKIREIEKVMEDNNAIKAMMSGSGPTVFGIFNEENDAKKTVDELKEKNMVEQVYLSGFGGEDD